MEPKEHTTQVEAREPQRNLSEAHAAVEEKKSIE
jgi:hypothetical protein